MPNQATAPARAVQPELVERLAKFFPHATPVRIPVKLSRTGYKPGSNGGSQPQQQEETIIEFGTPSEVLFAIDQPLEFADRVKLESKDVSLQIEASVVAVQYHPNRTVVAVRFSNAVPNWIVKS